MPEHDDDVEIVVMIETCDHPDRLWTMGRCLQCENDELRAELGFLYAAMGEHE